MNRCQDGGSIDLSSVGSSADVFIFFAVLFAVLFLPLRMRLHVLAKMVTAHKPVTGRQIQSELDIVLK